MELVPLSKRPGRAALLSPVSMQGEGAVHEPDHKSAGVLTVGSLASRAVTSKFLSFVSCPAYDSA